MIDIAVTVKWSKGAQDPASTIKADLHQPMAIALAMAEHLRYRVGVGEFATQPRPFSTRPGLTRSGKPKVLGYYVAPAYADKLGLGKAAYHDSAAFHRATGAIAGMGRVTGGMWAGLQVRNWGNDKAIIEFGMSSLGAKSIRSANSRAVRDASGALVHKFVNDSKGRMVKRQVRELVKYKKGERIKVYSAPLVEISHGISVRKERVEIKIAEGTETRYRRKAAMISNGLKAFTVFRHSKIGLLQPTDGEINTVLQAFRKRSYMVVRGAMGESSDESAGSMPSGVTPRLYSEILNNFKK